jgi:hypothetical protein
MVRGLEYRQAPTERSWVRLVWWAMVRIFAGDASMDSGRRYMKPILEQCIFGSRDLGNTLRSSGCPLQSPKLHYELWLLVEFRTDRGGQITEP